MRRLAYVVSSHGFGHAARACAVIEALWRRSPDLHVSILTETPPWFFQQSLQRLGSHEVRCIETDVGLVQTSALREDAVATLHAVEARLPFATACRPLADVLTASGAEAVVCDISPWGLAAAQALGLPSVLVENFTWDWIYDGYGELRSLVGPFRDTFERATWRVQTEPICRHLETTDGVEVSPPVSRNPRTHRNVMRRSLGVGDRETLVMLTMGGVAWSYDHLEALDGETDHVWVLAGAGRIGTEAPEHRGRHILLPHHSPLYHPDLVHAADVVVGKLGYSTVAEVAHAGARFAYVPRPAFPESPRLEAWVMEHLAARCIEPEHMESPDWFAAVQGAVAALEGQPTHQAIDNGAGQLAATILRAVTQA